MLFLIPVEFGDVTLCRSIPDLDRATTQYDAVGVIWLRARVGVTLQNILIPVCSELL